MGKLLFLLAVTALLAPACGGVSTATPEPAATLASTDAPPPTALLKHTATASPTNAPASTATPGTVCVTRPLEFIWRYAGDPQAEYMYVPSGMAVDNEGKVYVVDGMNHRVQKFDSEGQLMTQWGSEGSGDGQFRFNIDHPLWPPGGGPYGSVAVDAEGHVFVSDRGNFRIQKFDSDGQFIAKWGKRGDGLGEFDFLSVIDVDTQGYVYAEDCGNRRIQTFDNDGQFVAFFRTPFLPCVGLTIDRDGFLYVGDAIANSVHKFASSGDHIGVWSSAEIWLSWPIGMAFDNQGNLFAVSHQSHEVVMFDTSGRCLGRYGGHGLGEGQFYYPYDVAVDEHGNLYVTSAIDAGLQKLRPMLEDAP